MKLHPIRKAGAPKFWMGHGTQPAWMIRVKAARHEGSRRAAAYNATQTNEWTDLVVVDDA